MARRVVVAAIVASYASSAAGASVHAGSLVVPDDVIKFHFPPPQDDFFDPYAKDGLNRQIPHLFPRAVDRHDFHQHHGGVQG